MCTQTITRATASICLALFLAWGSAIQTSAEDPTGRFVQVSDGTLDTTTGLIWSFGVSEALGTNTTWNYATSAASFQYRDFSAYYVVTAYPDPDADPVAYYDLWYFDDWRLPTREQLVDAANAGISLYHNLDPANPFDSKIDPLNQNGFWSTATRGKDAYIVSFISGQTRLISKNSGINCVFVRSLIPEPPPSGPGKGKGKK